MGSNRGQNDISYAMYEELEGRLRVDPYAEPPYIYKRDDPHLKQSLEDRAWQIRVPIPNSKGIRKSLRTSNKELAIERAEELILEVKVTLKQGGSALPFPVEKLVRLFLENKSGKVRGSREGKVDAGKKSITQERFGLIEGKLRNYVIPFLGAKTDVRNIPFSKWETWESWRKANNTRSEMGTPKAITIQNEMGMIRELWKFGMEQSHIPYHPRLPFHDENLIPDDEMRRDTWEMSEWDSFSRRLREWKKKNSNDTDWITWDVYVAYQLVYFLANSGMRTGEVVKIRRKDVIEFFEREQEYQNSKKKELSVMIQVHPSTKTGARQVNVSGGIYAKRVWDKSNHKKKTDFLFCHLDGSPYTTKQFRSKFKSMIRFTNENERWGKEFVPYSLRHFYATTRLQNGTNTQTLCANMGVTEPYLRKHYSHFMTRLATDELTKIDKNLRSSRKVQKLMMKDDFVIGDYE